MLVGIGVHLYRNGELRIRPSKVCCSEGISISRAVSYQAGVEHIAARRVSGRPGLCSDTGTWSVRNELALIEISDREAPNKVHAAFYVGVHEDLHSLVGKQCVLEADE
jgi:hypothetical protein